MTIYRKGTPADREQYLDFANMVFSMGHVPHDFKALLPKVYGDGKPTDEMHNLAVDDQGRVRGVVAVLPGELTVLGETLKTGYLGTVSVHPYSRSEGHMKALMKMAIERTAADGADLMMLGGQRQRYEYFGFTPGGVQLRYRVGASNVRHALRDVDPSGIEFAPMESADETLVDAAYALHQAQPVRAARSREGFVEILRSWLCKPYIVLDGGAFAGYLVAGSGLDGWDELKLTDAELLPRALKAWKERFAPRMLTILVPAYDLPVNRFLSAIAEDASVEAAQQLLVFNFPKVIRAFLPLAGTIRPLADGELSMYIDGAPLTISVRGGQVSVEETAPADAPRYTARQAQEMFFAPLSLYLGYTAPEGWLPLPLYLTHADCF